MSDLFTEIEYDGMKPVKAIELGNGDISICDVAKDYKGRVSIGFKFLPGLEVGENSGYDGSLLGDVEPELLIITDNKKSLEVLLDKVQRAIKSLEE